MMHGWEWIVSTFDDFSADLRARSKSPSSVVAVGTSKFLAVAREDGLGRNPAEAIATVVVSRR
jgi:hypothetical protein